MTLFVLGVFAAATWYFMTAEERSRIGRAVRRALDRARTSSCLAPDPLTDALRARTPRLYIVPIIAGINAAVFLRVILSASDIVTPEVLIAWGGNVAPQTGNGEWWRLVSATFVHAGVLPLLVNTGALLSAGRILERLLGPTTFAAVYLIAGAMGALSSLWISAVDVTAGASAAVFGIYGLLLACWMWGAFRRSTATVRLSSVKRLAIPATLFIAYNLGTRDLETSAEIAGVFSGFMAGLFLTRSAAERKPPLLRVGGAAVASGLIVFLLSEPVRGLVDPRQEIAAVVHSETQTASTYDAAVMRFRKGVASATELVSLIERTIVPELKATNRRINDLGRVPMEHQGAVAAARDYLRMREEAWRLRAQALRKASMPLLHDADAKEQLALEAFESFSRAAGMSGAARLSRK